MVGEDLFDVSSIEDFNVVMSLKNINAVVTCDLSEFWDFDWHFVVDFGDEIFDADGEIVDLAEEIPVLL